MQCRISNSSARLCSVRWCVLCVTFFKTMYDKTIISSVFVTSGIIRVLVMSVVGVVTFTLIIQDITKTTSRGIV